MVTRGVAAKHGCDGNKRDEAGRGEIAPLVTKGGNIAAMLLCLGRRGAILRRRCYAW